MPVLFIGHGSPMNIILHNEFTKSLVDLGRLLPRPKAIMVISAHWLTRGTFVACTNKPGMIYDFYGFPDDLYKITYDCPGAPELAQGMARPGSAIRCDHAWGLDHASYSILRHMFPAADIPVFEMSLDYRFEDRHPHPFSYHYTLAKQLLSLRDRGVLIIGSGNMVHNLRRIDFDIDAEPAEWAVNADLALRSCILRGDHDALINFPSLGADVTQGIPTPDHYLPMIYALALRDEGEALQFTYEGFQNGSISMRGFRIG